MSRKSSFILTLLLTIVFSLHTQAQTSRYTGYHSAEASYDLIQFLAESYPSLVFLDTIGTTEHFNLPIIAMRISDNPNIDEDEPVVWYDGLHHAREAISMEVCLKLAEYLLTNYATDDQVKQWIDETEIWIIPMINPDGWIYCYDNELEYPYWRKNMRDNDENGMFNSDQDGVDVNRNYDYNWAIGGSGRQSSITYRGLAPFSEPEAQAKRDLALRVKPAISLSYHTYGEIVIYSWEESPRAPDQPVIEKIAGEIASRIPSITGNGTYDPSVSNCQNGFSRCWMYAAVGCLEYTVECAKEFIPDGETAMQIADDNLAGALYVLDRVHRSGIEIHAINAFTQEPIVAQIKVNEIEEYLVSPRTTEPIFGRMDKILLPGNYSLTVSAEGFEDQVVESIEVVKSAKTVVNVFLEPRSTSSDWLSMNGSGDLKVNSIYPNPVRDQLNIDLVLTNESPVNVKLRSLNGQSLYQKQYQLHKGNHLLKIKTRRTDFNLPSGYYFLSIQSLSGIITRRVIVN